MQSMIPQSLRLLVVGLNHRTAPLALRETVGFTAAQEVEATRQLKSRFPTAEFVILSTCNRVEFYIAAPAAAAPTVEQLTAFLAEGHGVAEAELRGHMYQHESRGMVDHLFSVAGSLDSMVVGETQILSQVKHAYHRACDAGGVGKTLHVLFQRALAAAKDVHEKTSLSKGRLSVATVAVDLAASVFDRFDDKTVVCVGAGKMTRLMVRHLAALKPGKLLVTNRSHERAEQLAAEFGAEARAFEGLDKLLVEADILLTGTGASEPIITAARFRGLLKARRYRPIVMVDIAVPRDIEAAVAKLRNVYLYNVDDLQEVAAGNKEKRDAAIETSRELLTTHAEEFVRWFSSRDVGPVIKALYEQTHRQAREELDKYFGKHPELTADQKAEFERLTHRLVGKLLHGPVSQLTTEGEMTSVPMLSAALKTLFHLEEDVKG